MKLSDYIKDSSSNFSQFLIDSNLMPEKTEKVWIHDSLPKWIKNLFCWKLGITAITFGRHIFYFDNEIAEIIIVHELVHVKQYRNYTFLGFLIKYLYEYFKKGYDNISFEIEAYQIEHKYWLV